MNICNHCNKNIEGEAWMSYNNSDEIKHVCSYICSNRNGNVGFCNIINIDKFTKYPIPYINFDEILNTSVPEDFDILNKQEEIYNGNQEGYNEYMDRLDDDYEYMYENVSSETNSVCSDEG
tara:strand:- start:8034 stop:8396 length:363 start_codon:yes stop_codon:yes gene_type:complete